MDKNGQEISTAITNLDLHDCARVCLTYGINKLYIVHPNQGQLDFARKIIDHWIKGFGGRYNPLRKSALEIIELVHDIGEIRRQTGAVFIGTSASRVDGCISWEEARNAPGKKIFACCSAQGGGYRRVC
jgi:hypothetical protein